MEAACPSSSSWTCVFVGVAEARSKSRRVRCEWGVVQVRRRAGDQIDRRRISKSGLTQDAADSGAAACAHRRGRHIPAWDSTRERSMGLNPSTRGEGLKPCSDSDEEPNRSVRVDVAHEETAVDRSTASADNLADLEYRRLQPMTACVPVMLDHTHRGLLFSCLFPHSMPKIISVGGGGWAVPSLEHPSTTTF